MTGITKKPNSKKTPLNFGISIWSPSSAVYGSPTFFYFQPLLYGKVFASTAVLIGAQLFLFCAKYFLGLEEISILRPGSETESPQTSSAFPNQTYGGFLTTDTPEIPLIVSLSVAGDYSNKPFSPSILISLPIFTLPGIRGTLPILILEVLGTIFIRAVVPPELTGAKPLKQKIRDTKLFNLSSKDIVKLLNQFGKYFSPQ